ncbi:aaa family atpase [Diplodia corticola]|uniref:Aaa family atpase n=1 Tax=Diplodia corticola TaxID=236234 RepID=A0A1J9RUJ3_9PEZI|nr:aaa family atpase [Diplodia corticola]OJD32095.1 aaa family atpase [Diplodia corticola]
MDTPIEGHLDGRLASLEERFAALEAKYKELRGSTEKELPSSASISKAEEDSKSEKAGKEPQQEDDKSTGEKADKPPPRRGRVVVMRFDTDKGGYVEHPLEPQDSEDEAAYAYVLRKFPSQARDDSMRDYVSELSINGPELLKLLRERLRHYPNHYFLGDVAALAAPYQPIILNWDKLKAASVEESGDEEGRLARSDLRLLLDDLSRGSGDERLDKYLQSRDALKKQRSITFDNLWTIFPPGTVVCGRSFCFQQDQLFIVESNRRPWPQDVRHRGNPAVFVLLVWIYDWDGKAFNRRSLELPITAFGGQKPIVSLSYYPLEANEEQRATIERELLERGKKFRQCCVAPPDERLFQYKGQATLDRKGFRWGFRDPSVDRRASWRYDGYDSDDEVDIRPVPERKTLVDSKVMVDFESYYKYGPATSQVGTVPVGGGSEECDCTPCQDNSALKEKFKSSFDGSDGRGDWEDLQYQLCPPRLLGYALHDKHWAQLDVTKIEEIEKVGPDNAYTSELHLAGKEGGKKVKDLLFRLVKQHGMDEAGQSSGGYNVDDIVENKGKGLVILLHGPPGVGKTLTAETVAIAARKPLLFIGVADVGTDASRVEENLQNIFDLASTWRAIILIDEADVFVQSRVVIPGPSTGSSALVSVFLRVLEYYKGILILTTNQIAQFDIAVPSRIHLAVKYGKLDETQTINIFKGFLDKYVKLGVVAERSEIESYVKDDLSSPGFDSFDGRQIRNVVTSAVGLARANGEYLRLHHVKDVVAKVKAFKYDLGGNMMSYEDTLKRAGAGRGY